MAMEQVMIELQESASLFEVTTPEYKQMKICRREVRYNIFVPIVSKSDLWPAAGNDAERALGYGVSC